MLLLLPFLALILAADDFRTVETTFGKLRGRRIDSYGGHTGFGFLGIPLGRPPIGELRFKAAVDPDPWPGVLDVFSYRNACLAFPERTYKRPSGGPVSEDCLYINVFSSQKCVDQGGCAVMAVLHGGGMKYESPASYKKEVVINNFANEERNVIVVTVPYRLQTLGFFQLAEGMKTSVDTNLGYRDCIFGFQWIQREIKSFGGDPTRVTIMGHSGGADMVQTFSYLPSTEGLFSQWISMSGPYTGGDFSRIGNMKHSRVISQILGCASEDEKFNTRTSVERVIKCMRSKTSDEILTAQRKMVEKPEESWGIWLDGPDGIMPDYEEVLTKRQPRKYNAMIGTTTGEFRHTRHAIDSNGNIIIEKVAELCEMVAYLKNYERPENMKNACIQYYSNKNNTLFLDDDHVFYSNTIKMANWVVRNGGNAFVYSYGYEGAGELFERHSGKDYLAPGHSEDYIYILGLSRNESLMQPKDFEIERKYTGLLANFVKNGDPSVPGYEWTKWQEKEHNYFEIDFDKNMRMPGMKSPYYERADMFWNEIAPREGERWSPINEFPPCGDIFHSMRHFSVIASAWKNKVYVPDKTLEAVLETYRQWVNLIQYFKAKKAKGVTGIEPLFLAENVTFPVFDEVENVGFDWLTFSLAAIVLMLVMYIVIKKVLECRRRSEYDQFH